MKTAELKFKKIGSNTHGSIVQVIHPIGVIGTIQRWHGMFEAFDHNGVKITVHPWKTRGEAAAHIAGNWEWEVSEAAADVIEKPMSREDKLAKIRKGLQNIQISSGATGSDQCSKDRRQELMTEISEVKTELMTLIEGL